MEKRNFVQKNICELCNLEFSYETKQKHYKKRFCGEKCRIEYSNKKQKATCLERYGAISPTLNVDIRKKQETTCLERYGVKTPSENREIRKKQKTTCFKNNGNDITFLCNNIKNKIRDTKLKNHGKETYNNRQKFKQTCMERYNVENPLLDPTIKQNFLNKLFDHHFENIKNRIYKHNLLLNCDRNKYSGTGINKIYEFECVKCHSKFSQKFIRGIVPRCLSCFPYNISKDEVDIRTIIPNDIEVIYNDKKLISPKELDIFIPKLNLAIEYDSFYYHSELSGKKSKNYHINKTQECDKKNIHLIHIFEDEWRDKREIVKSKLNNLLGKNICKIFARKCIIKEIPSKLSNSFLEQNHLQGKDASSVKIGLFYNNELVSLMTFGKLRLALGNKTNVKHEYEMYRFCNKVNTNIIGGASKLLTYFIKTYSPQKIISYADKRWVNKNKNVYTTLGFINSHSKEPLNYWYIIKNKRFHRFSFRKDQLSKKLEVFNPDLTEWENMQLNNYDRIWDCGNLKYEWNVK